MRIGMMCIFVLQKSTKMSYAFLRLYRARKSLRLSISHISDVDMVRLIFVLGIAPAAFVAEIFVLYKSTTILNNNKTNMQAEQRLRKKPSLREGLVVEVTGLGPVTPCL